MTGTTVFLFDVDGVIVEPLGYRAGITQTLKLLIDKLGIENREEILPTAAEISYMEACGLHDVWDITNIVFASILYALNWKLEGMGLNVSDQANVHQRLEAMRIATSGAYGISIKRPDYKSDAALLRSGLEQSQAHPPDVVYNYLVQRGFASPARRTAWKKLLGAFLSGTRSPYESYGTKLFQNIILGSDEFTKTYNLENEYTGPSLLKQEDKVAIDRNTVETIFRLKGQDNFYAGVYTARPSLPPIDKAPLPGYSPEAELALEASGMSKLPLVGMGMMDWLARKHDRNPESMTKPHTTQALAALLAAIRGNSNSETLELAYEFIHNPSGDLEDLKNKNLNVFVFEDTISGITPMHKLRDTLNEKCYQIKLQGLGIATDENKIASLAQVCTQVFPNVNEAFAFAIQNAGLELAQQKETT
jgi:hypothetical protein